AGAMKDGVAARITGPPQRQEVTMPFINLIVSREPNEALSQTLGQGITEITRRVLRKAPNVTSVALTFVAPSNWIVGGRSLKDQGLASFWLDIKVTAGTNTKDEKAAYLTEIFAFMREHLGS